MYQATHIIISLENPDDVEITLRDEAGSSSNHKMNLGHVLEMGGQYFDINGREIFLPENIKSIDGYISTMKTSSSEASDLFWATTNSNESVILRKRVKGDVNCNDPPEFKLLDVFLVSAKTIDLSGTILEKCPFWDEKDDWVLLEFQSDPGSKRRYTLFNLTKQKELTFDVYQKRADVFEGGKKPAIYAAGNSAFLCEPKFYHDERQGYIMYAVDCDNMDVYMDEDVATSRIPKHLFCLCMYRETCI